MVVCTKTQDMSRISYSGVSASRLLSQPLPVRVSITAQFRASFPLDVHWSPNLARVPSPSTTDHNCIYEPHHALARFDEVTKEPIRKQTASFFLQTRTGVIRYDSFPSLGATPGRSVWLSSQDSSPFVSDGLPSCSCAVMDGWLHLSTP